MIPVSSFRRLDVESVDGELLVGLQSGERPVVRQGGAPVREFVFGWSAHHVVDLGIDIYLLELRHDDGRGATWFLDKALNYICDQIAYLPEHLRTQFVECLYPYLDAVYHQVLSSPTPQAPPGAAIVELICEPTLKTVVRAVLARIVPAIRVGRPGSMSFDGGRFHGESLNCDLQAALDAALAGHQMRWLSPFDGTEQSGGTSIPAHEHRMGYRFCDSDSGHVFYVGATHHVFKASDIFIPALQCVLVDLPDDPTGRDAPSGAFEEYLTHAVAHAVALCDHVATTTRTPAVIIRSVPGMHMGHHVWNELSALDRLQRTLPAESLPTVIVPNADNGSEPFAPLDEIFPRFQGRVDRSYVTRRETIGSLSYRRNLFLVRSLDETVSTNLSNRVRAACLARPIAQRARSGALDYRGQGYTIVTLGVRVVNRSPTDVAGALQTIIDHLRTRIDKLVVVLDGHNARFDNDATSCYDTHPVALHHNPLMLEIDVVLKLRQRYQYTDLRLVSTIGSAPSVSIVWCDASAAFVGFWGAGFAKYRWICNKPGLAISGRWNLAHRHDLHIYDDVEFQQDPTPLLFIDPACITDRPEIGPSVSSTHPAPLAYANFEIDQDGLRVHLDRLLDSLDLP